MEWLAIAGLIQLQRQIEQQKKSLEFQAEVESSRKKERKLDIYTQELVHRGLSPLNARLAAENDIEIFDLMNETSILANVNRNNYEKATQIVDNEVEGVFWVFKREKYRNNVDRNLAVEHLKRNLDGEYRSTMWKAAKQMESREPSISFDDSEFRRILQEETGIKLLGE
jgi:hypothetical protein